MRTTHPKPKSLQWLDRRDTLAAACMRILLAANVDNVLKNAQRWPINCENTPEGLLALLFLRCPCCDRPCDSRSVEGLNSFGITYLTPDFACGVLTHPECIKRAAEDMEIQSRIMTAVAGYLMLHHKNEFGDLAGAFSNAMRSREKGARP